MGKLRVEKSLNKSGHLIGESSIFQLKESDYYVKEIPLDGDAPKEFIKVYSYEEETTIRRNSKSSWTPFIAKTAQKWYPHESVVEYMINRVGQVLGLRMNEIKLVRANGQIRFLSRFFLHKNERLIHGAEICGQYLSDPEFAEEIALSRKSARELFTFEFIRDAIRTVFPNSFESILFDLVKMIVFDGLTGNNDRHFYNWGVIDTKKKTSKLPTFAPVYDSARGLLWNMNDDGVKIYYEEYLRFVKAENRKGGNKVVNYIRDASPRISIEGNEKATHFELIDFLKRCSNEYREIANALAKEENERLVIELFRKEFYPLFIKERQELLTIIIHHRFETIRNL
jgi:hypothetical protein